jgi:hypothetical protein
VNLSIANGSFDVTGSFAAGIGAACSDFGSASVAVLDIANGNFRATAANGAGVGSGCAMGAASNVSILSIRNGTFNLSSENGAGIGSGTAMSANSTVGDPVIEGWNFTADGSFGAGDNVTATSSVNSVTIQGGLFHLTSKNASGVSGESVTILGCVVVDVLSNLHSAVSAVSLSLSGKINATTNTSVFVDSENSTVQNLALVGLYTGQSVQEAFGSASLLHFGAIIGLSDVTDIEFVSEFSAKVAFHPARFKGIIVSVPKGSVTVKVGDAQGLCLDGSNVFSIPAGELFVEFVSVYTPRSEAGLGTGAIAGIVVSVVVVLIAVISVTAVACQKRRKKASENGAYVLSAELGLTD